MKNVEINLNNNFLRERLSAGVGALWCLSPVFMTVYCFIMGALGKFTTAEEASAQLGFEVTSFNNLNEIAAYQTAFYIIGVIALIIAVIGIVKCGKMVFNRESARNVPWYCIFLVLLLWAVVCTLLSESPWLQFLGGSYMRDGLSSYFMYAAFFLCASMIKDDKEKTKLLTLFTGVVSYLCVIMFLQESGIPFFRYCFPAERSAVFNNLNHFGYVLCMSLSAITGLYLYSDISRELKRILLLEFAFQMVSLLYNDTFGAYVAVLLSLPLIYVFFARNGRKITAESLAPVAIFAIVSAVNGCGLIPGFSALNTNLRQFSLDIFGIASNSPSSGEAGSNRMQLWRDTIERIRQRPIFGFGPEGFYGENEISGGLSPHNEYLQIAGYLGIPGLILYLAALISIFVHHWKKIKKLSPMTLAVSGPVVAYLISACFGNPVFNTYPFFWMFLGLTVACNDETYIWIPDEKSTTESKEKNTKKTVILAFAIILAALVTAYFCITRFTEKENERLDLMNMRCAKVDAQVLLKNGELKGKNTFLYDSALFELVPADENIPSPYGAGTDRIGRAIKEYIKTYDETPDYDEAKDYRGRIIQVIIEPETGIIMLEWLPVASAQP